MGLAVFYDRLFDGVDPALVDRLEAASVVRKLAPHSYLFSQYSTAKGIYVLESGVIMIERSSAAGRRQILGFSYPGDYVGLTHHDCYEYSVQSLTDSEVREFPIQQFMQASEESAELKANVNKIGGSVFSHTIDQIFALGQKRAHERVCYLFDEIRRRGIGPDETTIDLPMRRQDIADYLGLTMETVSRAIRRLKSDGLIDIEGNQTVRLLDVEKITEIGSASGN